MNEKNMLLNKKIDLVSLDISFTEKPLIIGGLAMEYYGIRECGDDIDFIVSNEELNFMHSYLHTYSFKSYKGFAHPMYIKP